MILFSLLLSSLSRSTNTGGSASPSFLPSSGSLTSMVSSGSRLVSSSEEWNSLVCVVHSFSWLNVSLLCLFYHPAGRDKGAYYHELFLRSKSFLSRRIQRTKIKGEGARKPSSPETEPDFYNASSTPFLPPTRGPSKSHRFSNSMQPSGPIMNLVGSMSLQQLLASPAFISSHMQQQAHHVRNPPQVSLISRLKEYQAQVHHEQLRMLPLHQPMQGLASFRQHCMPIVHEYPVNSTSMAIALALSRVNQNPTGFAGSPDFWR
jgi:hypothetical protein